VRVGQHIKPPTKVHDVRPIYPDEARAAGTQGVVILEVRIEPDGRVGQARILRSIAALDQAAIDAVRQWMFTPTLLNGVATPVVMTVTVQFSLN
jgi:protein TonB